MGKESYKKRRQLAFLNWFMIKHSLYFLIPGIALETAAIVALNNWPVWQNLASQFGGLLLISGGLSLFWEIRAKRVLIEETLLLAGVAENLVGAGVVHVGLNYKQADVWQGLEAAHTLVVVASHPNTWRKSFQSDLEAISRRTSARVSFVVPDPNDEETMRMLAFRDRETPAEAKRSVVEFVTEVGKIFANAKGDFQVRISKSMPSYTAYRIDDEIVFTLYPYASGRPSGIPTLRVAEGELKRWMLEDMQAALEQAVPVSLSKIEVDRACNNP